jgi:signal transduction histidine kinase
MTYDRKGGLQRWRLWAEMTLLLALGGLVRGGEITVGETNLGRLTSLVARAECIGVRVDFEGVVLWASGARDLLAVRTADGTFMVKLDLRGLETLRPGDRVRLSGAGLAGQGLLDQALADNDGLHGAAERSGTVFLRAGRHPFRAQWFNGQSDACFSVDYAGPGLARCRIPDRALFRKEASAAGETEPLRQGLDYRCYEGDWEHLPHWEGMLAAKTGVTVNVDIGLRTRSALVGLEFSGFLRVEQDGDYTFWTRSDDGSRIFLGESPLRAERLGAGTLAAPQAIKPGQVLAAGEDCLWAAVEGVLTGTHVDLSGALDLELSLGTNRMYVQFETPDAALPELFSRVRLTGLCLATPSGGSRVAGRLLACLPTQMEVLSPPLPQPSPWAPLMTVAELRHADATGQRVGGQVCLTGTVVTAVSPKGVFTFRDDSGCLVVQIAPGSAQLEPGEKIVLKGSGVMDGDWLMMDRAALVDNNGMHSRNERTGAMYLRAGRHPLRVSWYDRNRPAALEVWWRGPGQLRSRIPDTALCRPAADADGFIQWTPGLNFRCYNGDWHSVPKTAMLEPASMGTTTNFEIRVANREEKRALEFSGFLDVRREGRYVFTLASDNGALMFVDEEPTRIQKLGMGELPELNRIVPRQLMRPELNGGWSEVEGTVDFAYEAHGVLNLEIRSAYGPMRAEVVDSTGGSALMLLNSRVRVLGVCQGAWISGGQEVAGVMVAPSMRQVELLETPEVIWTRYPLQRVGEVLSAPSFDAGEKVAHIQGEVSGADLSRTLRVADGNDWIEVQTAAPLPRGLAGKVEVVGRVNRTETNVTLVCGMFRQKPAGAEPAEKPLPLLTTARQIKQLRREEAQRHYPAKIQGVITLVRGSGTGFIIQDDTSAIDVWWTPNSNTSQARVGDFWEVEGETSLEFSPNVQVKRAVRLGRGVLPEPLRPAFDQLLNGSLDTRLVEVQGIVAGAGRDYVQLLTRSGKIQVFLSPVPSEQLSVYQNALIRIRGCVVPVRDQISQQIQVGQVRLSNIRLTVDEPAPVNPFDTERKHASELLLFDARAGSLQRVKLSGQLVCAREDELFVADGVNCVRASCSSRASLKPGDLVEVVGFPELGGASPVLREALWRKVGSAPLPAPLPVSGAALYGKVRDGGLVTVEARLTAVSGGVGEKVLELQATNRDFVARVKVEPGQKAAWKTGSRLQLSGVYEILGNRQPTEQQPVSFELLLQSPADVRELELPPWWTLRRALMLVGGLGVAMLAAAVWIQMLRRRVEEHAAQLAVEVRERELAQRLNLLHAERTRIAKDMHDQLGANVTRVGLLAELTRQHASSPEKTAENAGRISHTAVELGRTLDEIVWAVNPKNDSLDKFCDYIAAQAQELFQLTEVLCRVDLPPEMPRVPLTAEVRHNLFLTVKEALNNVVRHARAREVWIRFKLEKELFTISVVDDGAGFVPEQAPPARNGLQNMRKRLEDVGGEFAISSQPGKGTRVTLTFRLDSLPKTP